MVDGVPFRGGCPREAAHIMQKEVKRLDRVVIRFAGDSGDGMQLTGDRFTSETASFGNDLVDAPQLPGRDPGPRRHLARRFFFPAPLRRPRHHDPGDAPDVLVAYGGRAARQPGRPARRRDGDRQHRRVQHPGGRQGRIRGQPARGRLARPLSGAGRAADVDDGAGAGRVRHLQEGRRAGEEHVRARPAVLDADPRPTGRSPSCWRSSPKPEIARPTRPRSGPATTTATPPRPSRSRTR